ncbi:MAG: hypothetical protein K8F56_15610 [Rhodocyclaceae bacterium]|nr:hypothetical protein [Rhodocyclaceae bacterium]
MGEWLKRMSATAAGRLFAWLAISAVTATSLSISLIASWEFLQAAPWPVLFLSIAGVVMAVVFVAVVGWIFLSTPIAAGTYGSKYLLWYKLPTRTISWDFAQFLGGSSGQGQPVLIHAFQPRLKVNWGDGISPKRAFITCKATGAHQNVLLSPRDAYVNAEAVDFIPKGGWFQCQAHFGGITKEAFLQNWDGFRFVFEYDDKTFCREFSRRELEESIDRFWRYSNQRSQPKGRLKSG